MASKSHRGIIAVPTSYYYFCLFAIKCSSGRLSKVSELCPESHQVVASTDPV